METTPRQFNVSSFNQATSAFWMLLLFIGISVFYWVVVQGLGWHVTLYKDDIASIYYPYYQLLWQAIRDFKLPYWTHDIYGGFPVFAGLEMGCLYLPNLILFRLLPLTPALTISIILHSALMGFFMQRFLLRLGVRDIPAVAGALFFIFSGAILGHRLHLVVLFGLTWMPLGFYLLTRYKEQHLFLLGMSMICCLMLISGHPQMLAFSLVAWSLYFLLQCGFNKECLKFFPLLLGSLLFGMLLALPQLWSTFELSQLSIRKFLPAYDYYAYSLHPWRALTFILPHLMTWWQEKSLEIDVGFQEYTNYIGIIPLALILSAIFLSKWKNLSRTFKTFLYLALICLLLAFGRYFFFYPLLRMVPGFDHFRAPARFIIFTSFSLSILTALSIDVLLKQSKHAVKYLLLGIMSLLTLSLSITGAFYLTAKFSLFSKTVTMLHHTATILSQPYDTAVLTKRIIKWANFLDTSYSNAEIFLQWRHWLPILVILIALILTALLKRYPRVLLSILVVITLAELSIFYRNISLVNNPSRSQSPKVILDTIQKPRDTPQLSFRYYITPPAYKKIGLSTFENENLIYGASSILGNSTLRLKAWNDWMNAINENSTKSFLETSDHLRLDIDRIFPLLRRAGIVKIVDVDCYTDDYQLIPEFDLCVSTLPPLHLTIYPGFITAKDSSDAFSKMRANTSSLPIVETHLISKKGFYPITLQLKEQKITDTDILLQFEAPQSGLLFLPITNYPGWQATLNGIKTHIFPADILFMAMMVPEGPQTLNLAFQPTYLKINSIIALTTGILWLVLGGFILSKHWRRAK